MVCQHALCIRRNRDRETIVVGRLDETRDHFTEDILQVNRRRLEADLSELELRDAEQVVGEPREMLGLESQLVQAFVACVLRETVAGVVHQREPRLDLCQRCAQLMRREHHEFALDAIDFAQLRERGVLELDRPAQLTVAFTDELPRKQVAAERDDEQEEEARHERIHERCVEVMVRDVEADDEVRKPGDDGARHARCESEAQAARDHDDEERDGEVGVVATGEVHEPARDCEVERDGRHLETASRDAMREEHHRRREVEDAPAAEHQVDRSGRLSGRKSGEVVGDSGEDEHHPAAQLDRALDPDPAVASGHAC